MPTKLMERYFFFGLLFITLIFTFFVFRPFLIVLILGASLAIVLHPVHRWFSNRKISGWLASLLTVFLFILLICGPLFGIGTIVFNQSQGIYHEIISGDKVVPLINKVNDYVNNWLPDGFSFDFNQKLSDFFSFISDNVARIFSTTLATIFSFLLMLLTIFYFLKDGQEWKKSLITLSPMPDADDRRIIARLKETINSVMKGYLLIALLQGILMGVGLFIFGVPNPALWGVVAAITSLIPTAGTALVSVPAIIFLFITGHIPQAIGMLAWAALFVGLIDNLLSPMLISKRIKIPEFIILFSVLGGIVLLGPVGILIGPLSVSLLYTLVSMYRKEFSPNPIPK
jgi:predicted PurR-regulated permease PerM